MRWPPGVAMRDSTQRNLVAAPSSNVPPVTKLRPDRRRFAAPVESWAWKSGSWPVRKMGPAVTGVATRSRAAMLNAHMRDLIVSEPLSRRLKSERPQQFFPPGVHGKYQLGKDHVSVKLERKSVDMGSIVEIPATPGRKDLFMKGRSEERKATTGAPLRNPSGILTD